MQNNSKIYVAGNGLVGSAIQRKLNEKGYTNIITRTHNELELTKQLETERFFGMERPDYVFLAAAIVGGINANNTRRAEFIYSNLEIQNNIIHACYLFKVKKLLFLGSVCIYPKYADTPVKESALLTGEMEPTNKPYAIAKIAGAVMCESYNKQYGTNFITAMPENLYGIGDNYDLENSHVFPALIRRFHEAKESNAEKVVLWGTGAPTRGFLCSDDCADACVFLMNNYVGDEIVNVGSGVEIPIFHLAMKIKSIVGYKGKVIYDTSKPDGTPKRYLDVTKINKMGWKHKISLDEGIELAYKDYLENPIFHI